MIVLRTNVPLSEDDLGEEAEVQFGYHTAILDVLQSDPSYRHKTPL